MGSTSARRLRSSSSRAREGCPPCRRCAAVLRWTGAPLQPPVPLKRRSPDGCLPPRRPLRAGAVSADLWSQGETISGRFFRARARRAGALGRGAAVQASGRPNQLASTVVLCAPCALVAAQKTAVAVAHCKAGTGLLKLNGARGAARRSELEEEQEEHSSSSGGSTRSGGCSSTAGTALRAFVLGDSGRPGCSLSPRACRHAPGAGAARGPAPQGVRADPDHRAPAPQEPRHPPPRQGRWPGLADLR